MLFIRGLEFSVHSVSLLGTFLSQIHDERVVGTLEILCLLFNHYVEDLDIATPWEHSAVSMLTMAAQGIAKLEYVVNCLWWETQRFRC